jgi:hypothetical protein
LRRGSQNQNSDGRTDNNKTNMGVQNAIKHRIEYKNKFVKLKIAFLFIYIDFPQIFFEN